MRKPCRIPPSHKHTHTHTHPPPAYCAPSLPALSSYCTMVIFPNSPLKGTPRTSPHRTTLLGGYPAILLLTQGIHRTLFQSASKRMKTQRFRLGGGMYRNRRWWIVMRTSHRRVNTWYRECQQGEQGCQGEIQRQSNREGNSRNDITVHSAGTHVMFHMFTAWSVSWSVTL